MHSGHSLRALTFLLAFLLFAAASGFAQEESASTQPTNVLFFLVDDLGWRDLGCFGSTFYETPHLDGLVARGMKFTSAYAACPVCSPTRASILTGRYPVRYGITDYISPNGGNQPEKWRRNTPMLPAPYNDRLPHEERTLAEVLRDSGYATFFAGKWHLGPEGFWPEDQGFDINRGGIERGGPYGGDKYFSPYGNSRLEDGPQGEHLPDRLASETVEFMEENRDGPFLAYLSFYSVHTPLISREDLRQKYEAKRQSVDSEPTWGQERKRKVRLMQEHAVYAGMVEAMDLAVGKVLDALDRLGLAENTVVFLMSDNGGLSTSEGHPTSNLPLRAGKGWMYEGGIRVPMIVRWPGVTKPGSTCGAPVLSTDFFPTILEITGQTSDSSLPIDGESFVSLLRGETRERGPMFWHYPHYGNQGGAPSGGIRQGKWKLVEWYEDGATELYDLEADLSEQHDLAQANPRKRDALLRQLHSWQEQMNAKMPTPR